MFQIVTSGELGCPGAHSQWVTFTVSGGTIVSVGFQNSGNAQNFWASQIFPLSNSQAYVQVINSSLTTTNWWVVVVVNTAGDAGTSAAKIVVDVTDSAPFIGS